MSPAGIVMSYGARDQETARREVCDVQSAENGKTRLTVGVFATTEPFKVVDLTQSSVPLVPSIFDVERRSIRQGILFVHRFATDVARRITKDGKEHIEYVPTQVVTEYIEYIRDVFRDSDGERVKGILYTSSQTDGVCCAFFMESDECGGDASIRLRSRAQLLRLDDQSIVRFDLEFHAEPRFIPVTGKA